MYGPSGFVAGNVLLFCWHRIAIIILSVIHTSFHWQPIAIDTTTLLKSCALKDMKKMKTFTTSALFHYY
jgi:hypothetical protein